MVMSAMAAMGKTIMVEQQQQQQHLHQEQQEQQPLASSPASNNVSDLTPNEVAWQFVQEYYTYMNRSPNKLYRFYGEFSEMTVGIEGVEVSSAYGKEVGA